MENDPMSRVRIHMLRIEEEEDGAGDIHRLDADNTELSEHEVF